MIRCEGCGRHVRLAHDSCPFCDRGRRSAVAHKALQFMGGAATTVVLAACYGGPDIKGDSGYLPNTGNPTTGTATGTATGTGTGTGTTSICNPGGLTGTQFLVSIDWTDDGLLPTDSDGDGLNDTGCDDVLNICINDPYGVSMWDFGMTEIGAQGWTGEDCLAGYGAYNLCHEVTAPSDSLDQVCDPALVVRSESTLFDASKDPYLTYYLSDQSACFVFGADTAYYGSLGCTEML